VTRHSLRQPSALLARRLAQQSAATSLSADGTGMALPAAQPTGAITSNVSGSAQLRRTNQRRLPRIRAGELIRNGSARERLTSALYLGMRHPHNSLRPWVELTTGRPAAIEVAAEGSTWPTIGPAIGTGVGDAGNLNASPFLGFVRCAGNGSYRDLHRCWSLSNRPLGHCSAWPRMGSRRPTSAAMIPRR